MIPLIDPTHDPKLDEISLLRHVIRECVRLTDLMNGMGWTTTEGQEFLAACERSPESDYPGEANGIEQSIQ